MRKYGRAIKKANRPYRKASRRFRKRQWKRKLRRFNKQLNQVAEKKMRVQTIAATALTSSMFAGTIAAGTSIIDINLPAQGTDYNQRVGNKIFIRYIRVTYMLWGDATHWSTGKVGILLLKEKKPGGAVGRSITSMFNAGWPVTSDYLMKTTFSKMKLYTYSMQSPNAVVADGSWQDSTPYQKIVHFKFKIMKQVTIDINTTTTIPGIWLIPVYFVPPWSVNGGGGPAFSSGQITTTFTDV